MMDYGLNITKCIDWGIEWHVEFGLYVLALTKYALSMVKIVIFDNRIDLMKYGLKECK